MMMIIVTSPPQSNLGRVHHSCTTVQHCPLWLQWDASNSPPKLPFGISPWRSPPHLIPKLDRLHSPPQSYPDPISHFATVHFLDRQTARPRYGIGDNSIPRAFMLCYIDRDYYYYYYYYYYYNYYYYYYYYYYCYSRFMALWIFSGTMVAIKKNPSYFCT